MINLARNLLSSRVDQFKLTNICVTLEKRKQLLLTNLAAQRLTISNLHMSQYVYGAHTVDEYSKIG